jgi:hypothetical protein
MIATHNRKHSKRMFELKYSSTETIRLNRRIDKANNFIFKTQQLLIENRIALMFNGNNPYIMDYHTATQNRVLRKIEF